MSDTTEVVARAWVEGLAEDRAIEESDRRGAEALTELLSDAPLSVLSDPPEALVRQSAEAYLAASHRQRVSPWRAMWDENILSAARNAILALAEKWSTT